MNAGIFKGDNRKFGVEEIGGGVIYEADFSKRAAVRIAQLENRENPPKDWLETRAILRREGFRIRGKE